MTEDLIKFCGERAAVKRSLYFTPRRLFGSIFISKSRTMSAAKRIKLEARASEVNGILENGYRDCQNGVEPVENDNKADGGLSKHEIMRLRAEHIG